MYTGRHTVVYTRHTHTQGGIYGCTAYLHTQGGIYREVYTLGIPFRETYIRRFTLGDTLSGRHI